MTDHPGEKDFGEHIRGKKPAHPHHQIPHRGGGYEEGGPTGFNMQDGFANASAGRPVTSPNSVGQTPPADSGEVRPQSDKIVGGVDLTVPPYREGEADRPKRPTIEPGT